MAFAFLLALTVPAEAAAFEVRPLIHRLESSGRLASSNLLVSNASDQPLVVEFGVWHMRYDGAEAARGASAEDELIVFPPIASVPPGGVQAARLQWAGDPALERTVSYIVSVEQLPVASGTDGAAETVEASESGVQVLLTFNAYVHVAPPGAAPELVVLGQSIASAAGRSTLRLGLANRGDDNAYGSRMRFELAAGERRARVLPEEALRGDAELFLPPGFETEIELALPGAEWPASTTVEVVHDTD